MANLFILPSLLGDTILTTGGIEHYNDEPAVIITSSKTAALFEDLPHLEEVIVIDKKPLKKHWFDIWKATRGRSWNRVFDLKGSATPFLLKAKKRYIWTHQADHIHKIYQISRCFGSEKALPPTLWLSKQRLERLKPKRPLFAVAPIPGWRGKQWPLENFITLLQKFCKTYPEAQVALFGAPREKELVLPLLKALPKDQCLDTYGFPLLDSAALIHFSRLFIGNDSGLMHLSSALRTPTVALFGPSNEAIYGPWSEHVPSPHRTLRGEPFTGNVRQHHTDTRNYMGALKVEPVWDIVQERWETLGKQ